MWWDKFEVKLDNAFSVIDKNAGCKVYTNVMKLRMLISKIRSDFLVAIKTNIEIQMNMKTMIVTYKSNLSNYRNKVNQIHPNANNPNKTRGRIQTLAGRGGRGRGVRRGSGCNVKGRKGMDLGIIILVVMMNVKLQASM